MDAKTLPLILLDVSLYEARSVHKEQNQGPLTHWLGMGAGTAAGFFSKVKGFARSGKALGQVRIHVKNQPASDALILPRQFPSNERYQGPADWLNPSTHQSFFNHNHQTDMKPDIAHYSYAQSAVICRFPVRLRRKPTKIMIVRTPKSSNTCLLK